MTDAGTRWRGHVDIVTPHYVEGWAADFDTLDRAVEVEIRLASPAGAIRHRVTADRDRQDLRDAGIGDGRHGFWLALSGLPAGDYLVEFAIAGTDVVFSRIDRMTRLTAHDRLLISQHVPKCAGTSLERALARAYSPDLIRVDSGDLVADPASPYNLDPESWWEVSAGITDLGACRAVHGHFHLHKYRNVANAVRITVLREPIGRMISHYYFWRKRPKRDHTLKTYVLDHDLSLFQFAQLPFIRYFYTRVFFRGIDIDEFDYIGLQETYKDSLRDLSDLLACPLTLTTENRNPDDAYAAHTAAILGDHDLMRRLATLLADDIAFYHDACRRRG